MPLNHLPFLSPAPSHPAKRIQQTSGVRSRTLPRDPDSVMKTIQAQKESKTLGATVVGLRGGARFLSGDSSGAR